MPRLLTSNVFAFERACDGRTFYLELCISTGYQERDQQKRQEFQAYFKTKAPWSLVYVDESGIDKP